jgi:hypothetical protein
MWITQTYLGDVEPNAKLYIYYFYQDYNPKEDSFTRELESALGNLGDFFGNKVCLQLPNTNYQGKIEAEVREIRPLWEKIYPLLPGLFITEKPLKDLNEFIDGECYFVSLSKDGVLDVTDACKTVKDLADKQIAWIGPITNTEKKSALQERAVEIWDAVELKPGIAGVRFDIKKIFRSFRR